MENSVAMTIYSLSIYFLFSNDVQQELEGYILTVHMEARGVRCPATGTPGSCGLYSAEAENRAQILA